MFKHFQPHRFHADDELLEFGAAGKPALPRTVRCLVWNIYKAKRADLWDDFQALIADRELVLLQEAVVNSPQDAWFENSDRHRWLMARCHQHPRTGLATGVKTGSVARAASAERLLSPHREPIVGTHKSMLASIYPVEGVDLPLLVVNLHAINFVGGAKFAAHMAQVGTVIDKHAGPVLLAGDFNTWRPKRCHHFDAVASELGLSQAHWPRKTLAVHLHQHLDKVYFRDMQPLEIESLHHIRSSDHKPITVTFRL